MKKMLLVAALALMLGGCVPKQYETMSDVHPTQPPPQAAEIRMHLPQDAALQTIGSAGGKMIFCENYEILVETAQAGDVGETIRSLTGFEKSDLTVLQTKKGEAICYSWVWTAVGEGGDQICRGVILDDGWYHYCLCLSTPSENAAAVQAQWQTIVDSFSLG